MISIKTPHLELIPLDYSSLVLWKNQGRKALETSLNLAHNPFQLEKFYQDEMTQALTGYWIPMTHKFPLDFCWYTNWEIKLISKSCSIGGIGFSGLPNDEGETEIGYAIDQKYRGAGFATEAVKYLSQWAFEDKGLLGIVAETPKENQASQNVLTRNGFKMTGEKEIYIPEKLELYTWKKQKAIN